MMSDERIIRPAVDRYGSICDQCNTGSIFTVHGCHKKCAWCGHDHHDHDGLISGWDGECQLNCDCVQFEIEIPKTIADKNKELTAENAELKERIKNLELRLADMQNRHRIKQRPNSDYF